MQKFLRTLMLVALMLPFASQAQETLTVHDGTTTNNVVPAYVFYFDDYTRSQSVYPASELAEMAGGTISSIKFYTTSSNVPYTSVSTVDVYLMEVSYTTISALEPKSSATIVYSGTLDFVTAGSGGEVTITFTTPYTYNGGNLLVGIENTTDAGYKSIYFYGETVTGASWAGYNSSSLSGVTGSQRNFLAKTTFTYQAGNISCYPVKNLAAGTTTANSVSLTWLDTNNTGATYSVYTIGTDTTLLQAGVTTTSYTATGLSANTPYTFAVVANCAANDASSFRTVTVRTPCDAISVLPFNENFEVVPSGSYPMPYCWERYTSAFTTTATYPYSYSSTTAAHDGSRGLYFYGATTTAYPDTMVAILPALNVTTYPMTGNRLTFWAKMGAATNTKLVYVGLMTDPTDINTFVLVDTVRVTGNEWVKKKVSLANTAGMAGTNVAIMVLKGTGTMYIDDVTLEEAPACVEIDGLAIVDSMTTANSLTLVWLDADNTSATYSIYLDTTLVQAGVTGTTYTVTGLDPITEYTFAVEANCPLGNAVKMFVSGRTTCGTIAAADLPMTWGFEDAELQGTTSALRLPWCWTRYNNATSTSYNYYPYCNTSYVNTGSRALYFYAATSSSYAATQIAVMPQLDATLAPNTLQLDFWARAYSSTASYAAPLEIGTMTDPTDASTFTVVDTVMLTSATHEHFTVYMMNASATDRYIAMRLTKGSSTRYAIVDDLTLSEMPSCFPVSNLTIDTSTTSSVTLSWTDNMNNGATYSIAANGTVVATGITADAGSSIVSYTVTGLNAATIYTFSVVANCSADDASTPVEVSIMTPASLPYTTDFETGNAEWLLVNGANGWTVGEGVNNGGSHALYISNDENGTYAYTNTTTSWSYAARPFALNDSNYYVLNFDWKANGESTWDYLRAWLIPGNYAPEAGALNGASSTSTMNNAVITGWIDLNPATGKLNLQTDWQSVDDTLLLEPGVYTVLLMWANDGSGGTQPPAAVDNFSFVEYVPVPLTVTNLHGDAIAHNAFTAVWNGSDRQTEWHIAMQAAGDTNDLTWQTVAERSVPFFGLTPNTAYNVYVTCQEPLFGTLGDTVMATITTNGLPSNCTAIAEGTTTNGYVPLYGFYADAAQRVQSIYPASMLTDLMGNTYTSMKYSVSSGSSQNWANGTWYVKMGITTQSDLSAGWDSTALTTYYTGNLTANTTDGMTITFDSAFTYNGGNLLVEFSLPVSSGYTSCSFYGMAATGASRYGYSYSGYEAIADGSVQNFLPQLQFCAPYTTTCFPIDHIVAENATTNSVDIYWYPGNVETAWQIAYGTGAVNDSILLAEAVSTTSNVMTLTGLTADADYWFYVRPVCDSATYGEWSHVNFTTLPTCSLPELSNIQLANVDADSATIIITGELEHGTLDHFTFNYWTEGGDTTTVVSTGNSVTLHNLTPVTTYYCNITVSCNAAGTDDSRTTETLSFVSACVPFAIPYVEDFEEGSATLNCWTIAGDASWSIGTGDYSASTGAYSGSTNALITHSNSGNVTKLISPELTGGENGVQLQFAHVQRSWAGDIDELRVYSRASDTAAWQLQATYTDAYATWTLETLTISSPVYQVAFEMTDNYGYGVGIDSVAINLPPLCLPVYNLAASVVTNNSITLTWSDANTGATYTVLNMADTSVLATNLSATTYTATGLTAATAYTYGVVVNCSATEASDTVIISVATACDDVTTLPYNEGFENGLGCWTSVNGSADGVDWNAQPSFSSGAITPHTGNYMAASWSWNSVSMHANAWLISPKFVLPTVNAGDTLNFSWWDITSAAYPDSYSVVLSTTTNDTAAFTTIIRPYGMADTTGWGMQTVDLTAYAGQSIYIAFHHVDYDMNYLLIDDISLTIGAAPAPLPDSMQVAIAVNDATMGTTNPAPGVHYFYEGDTASVIAVPNTGYHLTGWSFIMNVNGIPYYDTTINVAVTNFFDLFTGGWVVEHGDNIYSFSITANFAAGEPELDTVTVNITVTNPLEGTTNPAPGTNYFTTGDTLSVVALPNTGYSVAGWILTLIDETGDTIYNNMTLPMAVADVFSVFQNTLVVGPQLDGYVFDVTPIFAFDTNIVAADSLTVILAVNDATMGTTTPAPGTYYYGIGDTLSFSVSANDGYHFENAIIALMYNGITMFADTIDDITEIAQVSNVVVDSDMVGMAINVLVNFAPNAGPQPTYWTVTLSSADTTMGTVSPEGETQVADGASFTATATANEGYRFVAWQSGQTLVSDQAEFTFTVVASTALVAVFEVDTGAPTQYFHVTGNVNDPAMGYVTVGESTNNTALVADGETVTLTAHANEGYHFVRWSTGETTESIDITVDGEDVTVTAIFEENVGIDDVDENDVTIYSTDSKIVVRGAEGSAVYVFDVNGRLVSNMANATETVEFRMANTGVYLVKVGAAPAKRVLVVR